MDTIGPYSRTLAVIRPPFRVRPSTIKTDSYVKVLRRARVYAQNVYLPTLRKVKLDKEL